MIVNGIIIAALIALSVNFLLPFLATFVDNPITLHSVSFCHFYGISLPIPVGTDGETIQQNDL